MSTGPNGRSARRVPVILFFVLGILIGGIGAVLPHDPAVVTAVSDVHSTRTKKSGRRYRVYVNATITNKDGTTEEIENLRVSRSSKSRLPEVGDTIQVARIPYKFEYNLSKFVYTAGLLILVGIVSFFSRNLKKKPR